MDKNYLNKLLDEGKFNDVLFECINKDAPDSIVLVIESYLGLKDFEKALKYFQKYRLTLEKDSISKSCDICLTLYGINKKFDLMEQEADYYKNLPYRNQETEEYLRDLDNRILIIKNNITNLDNGANNDYKNNLITSNNPKIVADALKQLFANEKEKVALNYIYESLKKRDIFNMSYVILLDILISKERDKILSVKKDDKYYTFSPKSLKEKYSLCFMLLEAINKRIRMNEKNISVSSISTKIIYYVFFFFFPSYFNKEDCEDITAAIIEISSELFDENYEKDPFYKTLKINNDNKELFKTKILLILNENKELFY